MMKGQTELVSVMILIGAVLVIGVAFTALAVSYVSNTMGRCQIQQILIAEQSNLVIYREYEDSEKLCLSVLRLTPSTTSYALAFLSIDLKTDLISQQNDIIMVFDGEKFLNLNDLNPKTKEATKIYYIYKGEYYSLTLKELVYIVEIPANIISSYVSNQKPLLICINKYALPSNSGAKLLLLTYIGFDLYEVGEWNVYP
ncbi:MAG: hypothetical protein LM582_07520 [Desulfurococcaceae archaeon]|nr:hypothetical protein [Desulfurococcaceae archaeon]